MANITGFSSAAYFCENPILINITDYDFNKINLIIQPLGLGSFSFTLYTNPQSDLINYDISIPIRSLIGRPKHPDSITNDQPIGTNYMQMSFRFNDAENNLIQSFSKNFIRGSKSIQGNNQSYSQGESLNETDKILRWGTLPVYNYYVDSFNRIRATNIIPDEDSFQMREIGCDPFYIRFMNSKGGYSYWYFPTWESNVKNKSIGWVERKPVKNSFSLGYAEEAFFKCKSRIHRDHFAIARALISSLECHWWHNNEWILIRVDKVDFKENNFDDITEFNADFFIPKSKSDALIW